MATEAEKRRCLQFSWEADDFAYWSEKFESYMHTKKLPNLEPELTVLYFFTGVLLFLKFFSPNPGVRNQQVSNIFRMYNSG